MRRSETHWSQIEAARRGDEDAFRRLWVKYQPVVRGYLTRRGFKDTDDLVQEVFVELIRSVLNKADPQRGRFRSLLLTVTRNVLAHELRKQNADKRGAGRVEHLGDRDVPAPSADPDLFWNEWATRLLELGLKRLADGYPDYFKALRLTLAGSSRKASAEALGCSENDIRNRVHRGKKKLIDFVQEEIWNYSATSQEYSDELRAFTDTLPE